MVRVCVNAGAEMPESYDYDCYNHALAGKWGLMEFLLERGEPCCGKDIVFMERLVRDRPDLFFKHFENGGRVDWRSAVTVACEHGVLSVLKYVIEKKPIDLDGKVATVLDKFVSRLSTAVDNDQYVVVQYLVENGQFNSSDKWLLEKIINKPGMRRTVEKAYLRYQKRTFL